MMPRAFGRGATIRKRMSHVSLVLGLRGEDTALRMKKKKISAPIIREAMPEDVRGEVKSGRAKSRDTAAVPIKKKVGGFGKKVFTRKVI